ncbi:uncharacterized protein PSFLO_07423 [Pseudozyma flocculosa]|uniref:Uncharacterized protein n=1 Tax=Pseudozyma flocculosa TaxID=84751 RepID=A0A5C3FCE3_9BASI|nr:uncharacterized protein PSFLO_07423 [Pseudozyma flocculosa]
MASPGHPASQPSEVVERSRCTPWLRREPGKQREVRTARASKCLGSLAWHARLACSGRVRPSRPFGWIRKGTQHRARRRSSTADAFAAPWIPSIGALTRPTILTAPHRLRRACVRWCGLDELAEHPGLDWRGSERLCLVDPPCRSSGPSYGRPGQVNAPSSRKPAWASVRGKGRTVTAPRTMPDPGPLVSVRNAMPSQDHLPTQARLAPRLAS